MPSLNHCIVCFIGSSFVLSLIPRVCPAQQCVTTAPPKDAVILFDGTSTSEWVTSEDKPSPWPIEEGAMVVTTRNTQTKKEFGDHQLHLEFWVPPEKEPNTAGNGNSGVYVHGFYEIQLIDSYGEPVDKGSCSGAIYGQAAPLVNASLPAGQWQSYDIIFHAPNVDDQGQVTQKARFTILHNGILIQDHVEADVTPYGVKGPLKNTGPLMLQYHDYPVKYRNIWVRPLDTEKQ